jgi:DNA repair protein RadD
MATQLGILSSRDRESAIAVIRRRLDSRDIRELLRNLADKQSQSVEWIVAEAEAPAGGKTRRLNSRLPEDQLVPFLVDLAGIDLLGNRDFRRKLASRCTDNERNLLHEFPSTTRGRGGPDSVANAIAHRKWQPGKSWAKHFTKILGFPLSFAGIAGPPTEPDSIEIRPFRQLPPLEDFQSELLEPIRGVLSAGRGCNRAIMTLPTGAGKTRTTVETILAWYTKKEDPGTVLWIAQSEELCEQAVQAFREVWIDLGHRTPPVSNSLHLSRMWGANNRIPAQANVVVASIQMLQSIVSDLGGDRRTELEGLATDLCLVVVDEAHRIPAPSYSEVLNFLGIDLSRGKESDIPLLGLTATPFRGEDGETRGLADRFDGNLIMPMSLGGDPVAELRARGVLSRPKHKFISSSGGPINLDDNPKYKDYFDRFGDLHPDLLAALGEKSDRNKQILDALCALPGDLSVLFFGCSVEHATAMAIMLRRKGRTAATITGGTRASTRRALIEEFRDGKISTLCNYGVLTTGFDAPKVGAVVISRPTASAVLYEQMIGRGMRGPKFGGTEECLVIDVEDNIHFRGQMAFRRFAEYWA